MRHFVLVTALLGIAPCIFGQRLAVGVKVGGVPTGLLQSDSEIPTSAGITDESKHWTVGPSFEFEFWKGLGVEVDALYRHVGYDANPTGKGSYSVYRRERDSSWEFPILGKYRFLPTSSVRPFLVSGYALRRISGSAFAETLIVPYGMSVNVPYNKVTYGVNYSVTHGFVIGGGVDFKLWHLQISPEFRFTNWNSPAQAGFVPIPGRITNDPIKSDFAMHNQVEILVGISFR